MKALLLYRVSSDTSGGVSGAGPSMSCLVSGQSGVIIPHKSSVGLAALEWREQAVVGSFCSCPFVGVCAVSGLLASLAPSLGYMGPD